MAAAPPPPQGQVIPPPAPLLTFADRYRHVRFDTEADNYTRLLQLLDPVSAQPPTATELLNSLLQESDDNSWAIAVHWQVPTEPTNPS